MNLTAMTRVHRKTPLFCNLHFLISPIYCPRFYTSVMSRLWKGVNSYQTKKNRKQKSKNLIHHGAVLDVACSFQSKRFETEIELPFISFVT